MEAGSRVMIAVRPESVSLSPGAAEEGAANCVSGTILRSVFRGQTLSVWIGVETGAEFVASIPIEATGRLDPKPGETWTAAWPAERTLVVREQ